MGDEAKYVWSSSYDYCDEFWFHGLSLPFGVVGPHSLSRRGPALKWRHHEGWSTVGTDYQQTYGDDQDESTQELGYNPFAGRLASLHRKRRPWDPQVHSSLCRSVSLWGRVEWNICNGKLQGLYADFRSLEINGLTLTYTNYRPGNWRNRTSCLITLCLTRVLKHFPKKQRVVQCIHVNQCCSLTCKENLCLIQPSSRKCPKWRTQQRFLKNKFLNQWLNESQISIHITNPPVPWVNLTLPAWIPWATLWPGLMTGSSRDGAIMCFHCRPKSWKQLRLSMPFH